MNKRPMRPLVAIMILALSPLAGCGDIPLPPMPDSGPTDPQLRDDDGDGYTPKAGDCDDADFTRNPGVKETPYNGKDDDCDASTPDDDLDGDGFSKLGGGDCDDNNKDVFPGATEIPYDNIDQDCSNKDLVDVDKDGFDAKAVGGPDCDDNNPYVKPTGIEICGDNIDQDCDGFDQECSDLDKDGDGYSPKQGDCDDDDKAVNPGATEIPYNSKDDDCKASTPDDDLDGDGFSKLGGGDCDDNNKNVYPGAKEIPYDNIDQNCDNEDLVDVDKDGYKAVQAGGDDCDDVDPKVHPGATEIPYDTVDQDCDNSDLITDGAFTVVNEPHTLYTSNFGVAASSNAYLVVWKARNSAGDAYLIRGQRYSLTGAKVGSPLTLLSLPSATGIPYGPSVASDGSGFLVLWRQYEPGTSMHKLMTRGVSATGSLGSLVTTMGSPNMLYDFPPIAHAQGGYAMVWEQQLNGYTLRFVRLSASGGQVGNTVDLHNSSSSVEVMHPHLAGNRGGGYLATWYGNSPSTSNDIYARALSSSGALAGSRATVCQVSASQYRPRAAFGTTDFLVSWYDYRQSGSNADIYGQRLTSSGILVGSSSTTNKEISRGVKSQRYPATVFCGGNYSVFFRDERYSTAILARQKVNTSGNTIDTSVHLNDLLYANTSSVGITVRAACGGTKVFLLWSEGKELRGMLVDP